jgi:mucin-19
MTVTSFTSSASTVLQGSSIADTDVTDDTAANITLNGGSLTLTATSGNIGSAGNDVDVSVNSGNVTFNAPSGSIYAATDYYFNIVGLTGGGAGQTIQLTSTSTSGFFFASDLSLGAESLSITAGGDIYLPYNVSLNNGNFSASGTYIEAYNITTGTGSISLSASGAGYSGRSIYLGSPISGGVVTLQSSGSGGIYQDLDYLTNTRYIRATTLNLTSTSGAITGAGSDVYLDVGTLNLTTSSSTQAIFRVANDISLQSVSVGSGGILVQAGSSLVNGYVAGNGNISVNQITSTGGGVSLSTAGWIRDTDTTDDGLANITISGSTSNLLSLVGTNGVGTSSNRLDFTVGTNNAIQLGSTASSVYVATTANARINAISMGSTAGRALDVRAGGSISFTGSGTISSPASITLIADSDNNGSGTITLSRAITTATQNANITLSGVGVSQSVNTATLNAGTGSISITGTGSGSAILQRANITAGTISLTSTGAGNINQTRTSSITLASNNLNISLANGTLTGTGGEVYTNVSTLNYTQTGTTPSSAVISNANNILLQSINTAADFYLSSGVSYVPGFTSGQGAIQVQSITAAGNVSLVTAQTITDTDSVDDGLANITMTGGAGTILTLTGGTGVGTSSNYLDISAPDVDTEVISANGSIYLFSPVALTLSGARSNAVFQEVVIRSNTDINMSANGWVLEGYTVNLTADADANNSGRFSLLAAGTVQSGTFLTIESAQIDLGYTLSTTAFLGLRLLPTTAKAVAIGGNTADSASVWSLTDTELANINNTTNVITLGSNSLANAVTLAGSNTINLTSGYMVIQSGGSISGSSAQLSITGSGNLTLTSAGSINVGTLSTGSGGLNVISSNGNVTVQNANSTSGTLNFDASGNGSVTLNQATSASGISAVAHNAMVANNLTSGSTIILTGASVTVGGTGVQSSGSNVDITANSGDITSNALISGQLVNLTASGDIIDGNGSGLNLQSVGDATLHAGGVIGGPRSTMTGRPPADAFDVSVSAGLLNVHADGAHNGISVNINGSVAPTDELMLLNSPTGRVYYNGLLLNASLFPQDFVSTVSNETVANYVYPLLAWQEQTANSSLYAPEFFEGRQPNDGFFSFLEPPKSKLKINLLSFAHTKSDK